MKSRAPKGTADMLPDVARAWEYLQRTSWELCARYGYEPVYTPLFEHTEVFTRGIGEATDIVGKEMYTFEDRAERSLTLRPEGTASIVRAALEHSLVPPGTVAKYYYGGPMFRYERPQKGRMRQFWQLGVEILGAAEPTADAEVITLLWEYFVALGIPTDRMTLLVNSMGDDACRPAYRDKVAAFIRAHAGELCDECGRRAESNPLRAFDCKNPTCVQIMGGAPLLRDELCDDCREHYAAVKSHLDGVGLPYVEDPSLVRGLDYYTRTVFEIQAEGLGAQNAIGGGGRYDALMESIGGPSTPGLGWALGFERTLLAMEAAQAEVDAPTSAEVYVVYVEDEQASQAFLLAQELRAAGISANMDHTGRSLKGQMKQAGKADAKLALILGPDEVGAGAVRLRDMVARQEVTIPRSEAVSGASRTLDEHAIPTTEERRGA